MSESELQTEPQSAPPESGELVVRMNGEELPQKRRPGRPLSNPAPVRSDRQKAADALTNQGIDLSEEQWEAVWSRYLDLRRIWTEDQLSGYFHWRCRGCLDGDSQGHPIHNGKHYRDQNGELYCQGGLNPEVKGLWPRAVIVEVAKAKGITLQF